MKKNRPAHAVPDAFWATHFEARYQNYSQAAKRKHKRLRKAPDVAKAATEQALLEAAERRLRVRHQSTVLVHKPDAPWWGYVELMRHSDPDAARIYCAHYVPIWREQQAAQARTRAAAIRVRASEGFSGAGGAVGGNARYQIPPVRYPDLVSSEHPILKLFVTKLQRGKHLLVGAGKDAVRLAPHGSKLLGCDAPYVVGNTLMRGFLRVEIDQDLTWDAIAEACRTAKIPLPNIAVGWMDANGAVCHPHLVWLLRDSVAFAGRARFKALFEIVLRGLTSALVSAGADPAGRLNAMRLKNPLSPEWQHKIFAEVPYTLKDLRTHIDAKAVLPGDIPSGLTADHPDEVIALGSNALFRSLTSWAARTVRLVCQEIDCVEWLAMVEAKARALADSVLTRQGPPSQGRHKGTKAVLLLAKRVADWNWKIATVTRVAPARLTPAEIATRRAAAGRKTAERRRDHTRFAIVEAARRVVAAAGRLTQTAVFAELRPADGIKSQRTVERHWPFVQTALMLPSPTNALGR